MEDFLLTHALWALGLTIFIDDIGLPLFPNGIALFTAAMTAASFSTISVIWFFLIAVFCATLGNTLLFFGGRHGLQKWIRNHNIWLFPSQKRFDKLKNFFQKKHGWINIVALSCITTFRPFSALIAGTTGMSPWKFFPFHFLGIVIWSGLVTLSGYYVGKPLLDLIRTDGYLCGAIIIVIFAYWYFWSQFPWHYFRKKKQ